MGMLIVPFYYDYRYVTIEMIGTIAKVVNGLLINGLKCDSCYLNKKSNHIVMYNQY